jgi:hypothetical protein
MVGRAINVIAPTPCNPNTLLNQWLDQQLSDWNDDIVNYVCITSMSELPALYECSLRIVQLPTCEAGNREIACLPAFYLLCGGKPFLHAAAVHCCYTLYGHHMT